VCLWIPSVNVKTYRGLLFHSAVVRVLRDLTVVLWDASSTSIFGAVAEGRPSCLLLVVSLRNANRGWRTQGCQQNIESYPCICRYLHRCLYGYLR
jgi:hypothetical protein